MSPAAGWLQVVTIWLPSDPWLDQQHVQHMLDMQQTQTQSQRRRRRQRRHVLQAASVANKRYACIILAFPFPSPSQYLGLPTGTSSPRRIASIIAQKKIKEEEEENKKEQQGNVKR